MLFIFVVTDVVLSYIFDVFRPSLSAPETNNCLDSGTEMEMGHLS